MVCQRRPQSRGAEIRPFLVAGALLAAALLCGAPRRGLAGQEKAPQEPDERQQEAGQRDPEREDSLLREALAYLKPSRAQLTHLLLLARQTDRRLELFQAEQDRILRALEARREQDPVAAARVQESLEQQRAQVVSQVSAFVTPQLVRLFSREQIGLAWRLAQGSPPEYARADKALLDPAAGFVQAASVSNSLRLSDASDLSVAVDAAQAAAQAERARAVAERARRLSEQELAEQERAVAEAQAAQARALYLQEVEAAHGALRGSRVGGDGKPFPQLLAESTDANELAPGVEVLVRRLFTSPRLAPVLRDALTHGLPQVRAVPRPAPPLSSLRLVRDYRMQSGLGDRLGLGPALEPLGGHVQNGLYLFGPGQGLRLPDSGVVDHYALDMVFRFEGGDGGYQKLIDFKNGAQDGGLYLYQGHVTFYTLADGGAPQPGRDLRLHLERNRATRIVRAWLDSRPIFAFVDLDDDAVFEKGAGRLFVDDQTTKNEQGPGALTSVLVWGEPRR